MMKTNDNIAIIAAVGRNGAIGKDNDLLCHVPGDLKRFRAITTGNAVIMGRKTFDSIGKPLPGRKNIVVSRQKDLKIDGVNVVSSLEEALKKTMFENEVFIIGGGQIYEQVLPLASKLYLTVIDKDFEADTFFPEIDYSEWQLVAEDTHHFDEFDVHFRNYFRKK